MSYATTQRTREIGIRLALGARAHDVLGLVMKQGLILTISGMTVGLAGAFVLWYFTPASFSPLRLS